MLSWQTVKNWTGLGMLALATAIPAAAQSLYDTDLAALNHLAQVEYGTSASQAFAGIPSVLNTPLSQITALTPTQLATSLNAGLSSGQGDAISRSALGFNILAGAHPISVADAANAQAAYNLDHNLANLIARLYAGIGVNLANAFSSILTPTVAPGIPQINVMTTVLQTMVLEKITTVDDEQTAKSENKGGGVLGLRPMIGASAFFEQSSLRNAGNREMYGINLMAELPADRFLGWVTVPVQWTTYAASTYTTYGVDVGGKYELIKDSGLYVGAHGNYLGNSGDATFEDYNWAIGPFIGYTYHFSPRFEISAGVLSDYVQPHSSPDTWVGAVGINFGTRLTDHFTVNAYYSYWRDLGSDNTFFTPDWHDVGVDLAYTLGKAWRLVFGVKTSLGYQAYNWDYQLHTGAAWRF